MPPPDSQPRLSADRLALLDDLADAFESDWSPTDAGRIEKSVAIAPADLRRELVRELVRIELDLRIARGYPADLADYLRRFPELLEADGWPADELVASASRPPRKIKGVKPPPPTEPPLPQAIGPYRIERRRRVSLQPQVFDAIEPATGRAVLLSLYPPMKREEVERSHRAALAVADCRAAGVPAVVNVGRADGCLYIVQERPLGKTIAELSAEPTMDWQRAVSLATGIARAVVELHATSASHGAINPESCVVDPGGRVHVTGLPPPGQMLGQTVSPDDPRLPHLCPENAWSFRQDDARPADIFAVGAILYHLLAGRPLYVGSRPKEVLDKALACSWDEQPIDRLSPPQAVRAVLRKALERNPDLRHPSAEALAAELNAIAAKSAKRGCASSVVVLFAMIAVCVMTFL